MTSPSASVIVGGARTSIGRLLGALKGFSGVELGAIAIEAALARCRAPPDRVQYVIMGQVLQAGEGQITARQAAVKAGIPMTVPALTINKVCLSGLDAIALADQLIRAGEFDVVVAGGMESMTNSRHLLPKSREGFEYGDTTLVDSMAYDGLWDAFTDDAMGALTDKQNAALGSVAKSRTHSPRVRTSAPRPRRRTADSPMRLCRCVFRSAGATRCWSTSTRACGPRRQWSRWANCVPPSPPTAPLPPVRPRRSPTAGARLSSPAGQRLRSWALSGLPRSVRTGSSPGRFHTAVSARQRHPAGTASGGAAGWRPRSGRDQRGVRRRGGSVDAGPQDRRGQGQRRRRRHREGAPAGHVWCPAGPSPGARTQAPRWRSRRSLTVRRRRSRRCAGVAGTKALAVLRALHAGRGDDV